MKLSILLSFLFLFSCGKTNFDEAEKQDDLKIGTLSIPAQGIVGGGPSLFYNNESYQIDFNSSSAAVYEYVQKVSNGEVGVQAISNNNYSKTYNVKFSGSFIESQCTFNPTAVCTNASLTSLSAY